MKKLSIIALALVFLASGCKKEETSGGGGGCTLSSSTLPGVYKITAQTYQADAQSTPVDDFANSEPCEKDDLITIKADGTINITEGATSCDPPNDPITLNWSLSGNNLTVGTLGFSYNTSIIEYNCNYFKEKYIDPDDQSIIITTYTKQ